MIEVKGEGRLRTGALKWYQPLEHHLTSRVHFPNLTSPPPSWRPRLAPVATRFIPDTTALPSIDNSLRSYCDAAIAPPPRKTTNHS
jgi:hypothetical protein